jgi:glutathione S-transferase
MKLVFHERVGLNGRRISPFSWRIRYAFAHKGLEPEVIPTRFADVRRIRDLSGQHFTPIIEHDGTVVHETWRIACHLEDRFPDRPSLFGGAAGRGAARFVNIWSDTVLSPTLRPQFYADFIQVIDPGDRAYFRETREKQLGTTLEEHCANRDARLPEVATVLAPLQRTLAEQPFLAGATPAYADYIVFSVFQWARVGSPRDVLALLDGVEAIAAWRSRMVGLHDGMGDRFALYPTGDEG